MDNPTGCLLRPNLRALQGPSLFSEHAHRRHRPNVCGSMLMQAAMASLSEGSPALQPAQADRKVKDLIACIVEPRADALALDHVVQNVADFLGPSVPIQVYHGNTTNICDPDSDGEVSSTCQLHRDGRVELHSLGVDNLNGTEYSQLLTTRAFWEAKRGWQKTLIFQTDSVFCSATEEKIDDFMHLDFVGARAYDGWEGVAMGGNGGFSLRDTQLSFDCSSEDGWPVMEDALFIRCFQEKGGRLATKAEQERFATQNYFVARSLGAHQVNVEMRWTDPGNASAFQDYCPEYLEEMKLLAQQRSTGDRDYVDRDSEAAAVVGSEV